MLFSCFITKIWKLSFRCDHRVITQIGGVLRFCQLVYLDLLIMFIIIYNVFYIFLNVAKQIIRSRLRPY